MFDEGVKVSRGLEKDLSMMETRVEVLLNVFHNAGGTPEMGLFDLDDDRN